MRKLIVVLLATLLAFTITACRNQEEIETPDVPETGNGQYSGQYNEQYNGEYSEQNGELYQDPLLYWGEDDDYVDIDWELLDSLLERFDIELESAFERLEEQLHDMADALDEAGEYERAEELFDRFYEFEDQIFDRYEILVELAMNNLMSFDELEFEFGQLMNAVHGFSL